MHVYIALKFLVSTYSEFNFDNVNFNLQKRLSFK